VRRCSCGVLVAGGPWVAQYVEGDNPPTRVGCARAVPLVLRCKHSSGFSQNQEGTICLCIINIVGIYYFLCRFPSGFGLRVLGLHRPRDGRCWCVGVCYVVLISWAGGFHLPGFHQLLRLIEALCLSCPKCCVINASLC